MIDDTTAEEEERCDVKQREEQGERMKIVRAAFGPTLREFCDELDIEVTTWSNYETGTRHVPVMVLRKVKRMTQISTDYIIDGDQQCLSQKNVGKIRRAKKLLQNGFK